MDKAVGRIWVSRLTPVILHVPYEVTKASSQCWPKLHSYGTTEGSEFVSLDVLVAYSMVIYSTAGEINFTISSSSPHWILPSLLGVGIYRYRRYCGFLTLVAALLESSFRCVRPLLGMS